jgi:hypothetical protein
MTRSRTSRWATRAALVALAAVSVACQETTVNKLMAEPHKYADKDVGLKGQVVDSASLLGQGAYRLDDGTGTIWIVSKKGVPRKGARVAVRGRVRDVVNVGDVIKLPVQVGSGLVLIEDDHKGL